MKLGYIGLGKMGFNMVERLLEKKHQVVVYARNQETVKASARRGAEGAGDMMWKKKNNGRNRIQAH
jgi:6-phosphogluconate dehydrogenase